MIIMVPRRAGGCSSSNSGSGSSSSRSSGIRYSLSLLA
jgi:hypothetical protein